MKKFVCLCVPKPNSIMRRTSESEHPTPLVTLRNWRLRLELSSMTFSWHRKGIAIPAGKDGKGTFFSGWRWISLRKNSFERASLRMTWKIFWMRRSSPLRTVQKKKMTVCSQLSPSDDTYVPPRYVVLNWIWTYNSSMMTNKKIVSFTSLTV